MTMLRPFAAAMLASILACAPAIANETGDLDGESLLVTSGDPNHPRYANAGDNLRNGVVSLYIEFDGIPVGGYLCTAAVIDDRHILTAAHCVRESGDTVKRLRVIVSAGLATPMIFDATAFSVHPAYDLWSPIVGAFADGDIAVVELPNPLPTAIERYDLYRTADEFGETTRHYGHGRSGRGNKGATGSSDFFFARTGLNMYEATLGDFGFPSDQLLHDFDSGGEKHNAMDWWFSGFFCGPDNPNPPQAQDGKCTTFRGGSFPDRGFGKLEVGVAPGDSGGPGFIDGKIAGVHSFGFTYTCGGAGSPTNGTDFDCGLNSSWGEMSGDTRVSTFAGWVDSIVTNGADTTIPELAPATVSGVGVADIGELTDVGRAFLSVATSRTLRKPVTLKEALAVLATD
jgi:hypothetical protein